MNDMTEQELRAYVQKAINPILEPLMVDLLINRPDDVVVYVAKWMADKLALRAAQGPVAVLAKPAKEKAHDSGSEEEEDEEDVEDLPLAVLQKASQQKGRVSVSAEAYGMFNKKENFKARVIPKSKDQVDRIIAKLSQSFMFQALDTKDRDTVVDAMEVRQYQQGDMVITQGEDGDNLYVVDQGQLDCFKVFKKEDGPKHLKVYQPGESFGELSLLYNAPRAASIQAKTPAVLFGLDRATFNNIVKDAAVKKREQYEAVLSRIEILQSLDKYELTQICDGIKEQKFVAGEYIIREGESGDRFYMIEDGSLIATKTIEGAETKVFAYKSGDYFGELALIKNVPRQANIVAQTDGALVWLDSATFKRLLGPIEDILARNVDRYEKFVKQ